MANLAKIKEVHLYVALSEHAQECYDVRQYLDQNGIPYTLLAYFEPTQYPDICAALSSWVWTGEQQRTISQFPIVTWKNCYDDYETDLGVSVGLAELQASVLVANKHLI